MRTPRKRTTLFAAILLLLIGAICWSAYLLFQNEMWKMEAIRYSESSAIMQANGAFRRGILSLYKIEGKCDNEHFSGQHDGPFEVWIAFYQPSLGAAHRIATEHWVAKYNEQMHRLQDNPKWARKRIPLEKTDDLPGDVK